MPRLEANIVFMVKKVYQSQEGKIKLKGESFLIRINK